MSDYFETRERLRKLYVPREQAKAKGEALGAQGFLTEVNGRVILTAPASSITVASQLPSELSETWEKAASGNDHMLWLQGRFVEAERANRNGAFWSTEDLQFGEMSVKHGPLNWLHEERTVVGTIADNAVIHPQAPPAGTSFTTNTANASSIFQVAMPRPYMAAVSAVWKWVHPDKVDAIEAAAADHKLWYSMECIARQMSCESDGTRTGCGKAYDYVTAMTQPQATCEHIASRSSARRMVDPSFLGGAVIVPPMAPGWGAADVEIMRQAASLAEQTHTAAVDVKDAEWEALMAGVLAFATTR